jgi:hypothetical protein
VSVNRDLETPSRFLRAHQSDMTRQEKAASLLSKLAERRNSIKPESRDSPMNSLELTQSLTKPTLPLLHSHSTFVPYPQREPQENSRAPESASRQRVILPAIQRVQSGFS